MIRYSFLIPFWNLEHWMLQRMLDSIPHRDDVEIILLDNASDAVDKDYLLGLKDAHVKVIFQQERTSIGSCRNELLGQAQGEWIIFADADDRFFTEELEHLMEIAAAEDYGIIYWGLQTVQTNGSVSNDSYGYQGTTILPLQSKNFLMSHRYETPRKMFRKSLLLSHPEIRFDEIPIYEDVVFSIRLLLNAEKVGVYPPMVYQYIRRDTSILGQSWTAEVIDNTLKHLFYVLDILRQNKYPINEQEVSKGCLIRMKHASKWHFCIALIKELRRYGWTLFYRDLIGAGFETYEANIFKAFGNYMRVKIGGILHKNK